MLSIPQQAAGQREADDAWHSFSARGGGYLVSEPGVFSR